MKKLNHDNIIINTYNKFSESVKLLRAATGWARLSDGKMQGNLDPLKPVKIINWGHTGYVYTQPTFNPQVKLTLNKLSFFNHCKDMTWCPEFTTDKQVALEWLNNKKIVIARSMLTSYEGKGITVLQKPSDLTEEVYHTTKVYVKYIRKTFEFRIHVIDGKVVRIQQKVKSSKFDEPKNWFVRSHKNGFIFQSKGIYCPQVCQDVAVEAVKHCGLDFGGVDVIYNQYQDMAYVLEINSAPGIEGETVQIYVEKLREMALTPKPSV